MKTAMISFASSLAFIALIGVSWYRLSSPNFEMCCFALIGVMYVVCFVVIKKLNRTFFHAWLFQFLAILMLSISKVNAISLNEQIALATLVSIQVACMICLNSVFQSTGRR
jgi:hypothetical protein